jgi:hypothetical protein
MLRYQEIASYCERRAGRTNPNADRPTGMDCDAEMHFRALPVWHALQRSLASERWRGLESICRVWIQTT